MAEPTDDKPRLSAYAFSTYGGDAKLYNGVFDLEATVEALRRALVEIRLNACQLSDFQYGAVRECSQDMICACDAALATPGVEQVREEWERLKEALEENKAGWRCYHCGKLFCDPVLAAEHFGDDRKNPRPAACEGMLQAMRDELERQGIHRNFHNAASIKQLGQNLAAERARADRAEAALNRQFDMDKKHQSEVFAALENLKACIALEREAAIRRETCLRNAINAAITQLSDPCTCHAAYKGSGQVDPMCVYHITLPILQGLQAAVKGDGDE